MKLVGLEKYIDEYADQYYIQTVNHDTNQITHTFYKRDISTSTQAGLVVGLILAFIVISLVIWKMVQVGRNSQAIPKSVRFQANQQNNDFRPFVIHERRYNTDGNVYLHPVHSNSDSSTRQLNNNSSRQNPEDIDPLPTYDPSIPSLPDYESTTQPLPTEHPNLLRESNNSENGLHNITTSETNHDINHYNIQYNQQPPSYTPSAPPPVYNSSTIN